MYILLVALFTRAWIEIRLNLEEITFKKVALFTRAWIEMQKQLRNGAQFDVALFTRAWIEIAIVSVILTILTCRPLYEGVD